MSDFHEHLLEPTAKKRKRSDDPKVVNPPIPWVDGEFEKFINISEDGATVSFKLQKGTKYRLIKVHSNKMDGMDVIQFKLFVLLTNSTRIQM